MRRRGSTTLRPVEARDLDALRRWRNNPAVSGPALGRRFPSTAVGEQRWFDDLGHGRFPDRVVWAVSDATTDDAVGLTMLTDIDWIHRTADFGIWIGEEHWGRGHASAATQMTVDYAFGDLGLAQIRLRVLPSNTTARKVYERIGFVDEAVLVRAVLVDGARHDLCVMRLEKAGTPPPT